MIGEIAGKAAGASVTTGPHGRMGLTLPLVLLGLAAITIAACYSLLWLIAHFCIQHSPHFVGVFIGESGASR